MHKTSVFLEFSLISFIFTITFSKIFNYNRYTIHDFKNFHVLHLNDRFQYILGRERNMTCQLKIHHTLSTIPSRNINNIMVLFSLTSKLNITINGETKDVSNYIILINHGDIYNINHGENIIELMIPVFIFINKMMISLMVI